VLGFLDIIPFVISVAVLITPGGGLDGWSESVVIEVDEATNFIDLLRHSESAADRRYARKHLQRFTINISKNIVEEWKGLGKVREIEDILVLTKEYSGLSYTNRFGLVVDLV
jgi:hypothetical protein